MRSDPQGKRTIIIVPSMKDLMLPDYQERYWGNFVEAVKAALEHRHIDCDVKVLGEERSNG